MYDSWPGGEEDRRQGLRCWWVTSFTEIPKDALPTVLNPLARLASSPVIKAFLGSPVGSYDIRRAMDDSRVVWICPPGTGPTDRLLISLLVRDMLRAGLSRRDMREADRTPFRLYLDELISLDGAASSTLAEITEQLRKFSVRMHGMTQLLHRLSPDVRTALLQNASYLSTTAGSVEAIRHITSEWGSKSIRRRPPSSTTCISSPERRAPPRCGSTRRAGSAPPPCWTGSTGSTSPGTRPEAAAQPCLPPSPW